MSSVKDLIGRNWQIFLPGPASLEVEHSPGNFSPTRGLRFESRRGRFFSGAQINAQKCLTEISELIG